MKYYVFFEIENASFLPPHLDVYYECNTDHEVNKIIQDFKNEINKQTVLNIVIKDIKVFYGQEKAMNPKLFEKTVLEKYKDFGGI